MNKFHGTGVAMVTPFNADGTVDYQGLEKLINYQIDGGVEYLVSLGTTGESSTLTKQEKKSVWEFTKNTIAGRVTLVAGIGGNSTSEVIENIQEFDKTGYDAILSVSPYYNRPTQEGIYQHYKAIAKASTLPIILYNVPGRTGGNMLAETTLRLAHEVENIIGIKEAAGNFDQFNQILKNKPADFLFISGDDSITLPLIAMGAVGIISVAANAVPAAFSEMIRECLKGNFEEARKLHYNLLDFTNSIFLEGNPGGIKAALKQLSICNDTLRLPLVNVSESVSTKIKITLQSLQQL